MMPYMPYHLKKNVHVKGLILMSNSVMYAVFSYTVLPVSQNKTSLAYKTYLGFIVATIKKLCITFRTTPK